MSLTAQPWCIGVVIPACNEEQTIQACIRSTIASLAACTELNLCWIVVVADCCTDGTAAAAGSVLQGCGEVLECSASSAGAARRSGAERILRHFAARPTQHVWIANTDGDSQPSPDWIARQLALAEQGYCGVAGIVRLDDKCCPALVRALMADYVVNSDGTHPHVHGANLGIRADAYVDAGGWSDLTVAEDHCLWRRARARGWKLISSIASVVTTSARLEGRAKGGFADTLRRKQGAMRA
jgi:glycosyltransferase involved in cell wall biosynthesis